jgi:hypothetical protein
MVKSKFQLVSVKTRQGTRGPWSVVEGVIQLPDGAQATCEFIMDGQVIAQPGMYELTLVIATDRNKRLAVYVNELKPSSAARPAAAA